MKRSVCCWIAAFSLGTRLIGASVSAPAVFYVAPDGDDSGPGDAAHPFATLQKARDAARQVGTEQARRILVHGGAYFNVSLTLAPEDSGLTIAAVSGERPVLYGGEPITGWTKDGDHCFSAPLPEFPQGANRAGDQSLSGHWEVRLLEVAGKMMPRARYPATGRLTHLSHFNVRWMSSTGGGWQRKPTRAERTTLIYRPGDLGAWLNVKNAEITVYHMWDASCVGVKRNDLEHHTLTLSSPTGHPPGAFGVRQYVVWNIRRGMTSAGQWYHDRVRHRLVYWPLPGQDMAEVRVVAPTTSTVLRVQGTRRRLVRDVHLKGLTVCVTTVPLMAAGFAAGRYDGAISVANAEDCSIENVKVTRVAGHGINAGGVIEGFKVRGCKVGPCGAGGIYVGGHGTVIEDNLVFGIGRAYPSAIGIYRGGRANLVRHNEVHDCSYTGINYGGVSNVIEANLIYDCMKVLHDGAAIYLFAATNCLVRGNVARDIVNTGGYGASAYYLDERSTGCVVEDNLALRVAWPSHNHMATNNIIRNNLFLVKGDAKWTFPRSAGYTVSRNVLYATGKIRLEHPEAVVHWQKNLFYSGTGRIERVRMNGYRPMGTVFGPPGDTVVADPLFKDWEHGDYSFAPDSPAHRLGITPIDVRGAGRRPGGRQPTSVGGHPGALDTRLE